MAEIDNLSFDKVPLNFGGKVSGPTYSGNVVVDYGQPPSVTGSIILDPIPNYAPDNLKIDHFTIVEVPATATSTAIYKITGTTTALGQKVTLEIAYAGTMPSLVNSVAKVDGKAVASSQGGTVTSCPVCFVSGTRIATSQGDVAVEDLAVGDFAVTVSGVLRPIRWIGHRVMDCRSELHLQGVAPIRIAAHAFGAELPVRDLLLSPGHPVLVGADEDGNGGDLVPIMCLLNGTTIERETVDSVTYWHVELDTHDILLAEDLPVESYLDWGDRTFFTEAADHSLASPDFVAPGLGARCRPVAIDGPIVEAERRRLDVVFATRLAVACAWPVEGMAMPTTPLEAPRREAR